MPQRREHLTSSCHPLSETSHYANKQSHSKIRKQTYSIFVLFYSKGLWQETDDIKLNGQVTGKFPFHFPTMFLFTFRYVEIFLK